VAELLLTHKATGVINADEFITDARALGSIFANGAGEGGLGGGGIS
jgi:hypothetical protein